MLRRCVLALLLGLSGPAAAGPWAEPDDRQLRNDVELLKAAGVLRGPVISWPLPWAQIARGLESVEVHALAPHLAAAHRRLTAQSERALLRNRYEVRVAAATDPALFRDFGAGAREEFDGSVRAEHDLGKLTIGYGVGYRPDQDGKDYHFEPSYAALQLGNWAFYGGNVPTWWGPGVDSALLFSTNARTFPRIGFKRLAPEPIDFPVLRWLGPVRFDIFAGVATEARDDFDDPVIAGMRVEFEPVRGLSVGLSRGLQLCGEGRPCDFGTIIDAIIGIGDADNTGTFDEPGNQLAGFDISYSGMAGKVGYRVYGEAIAEDEDNTLIEQFGRLAGIALSGPIGTDGATWQLGFEAADTLAIKAFGSERYPGSFYWNFIYTDGWTYRSEVIGHTIGGDGKVLSLSGSYTDAANRRFYGSLRAIDYNRLEASSISPSVNAESVEVATLGADVPTRFGDLRAEVRLQEDAPNTPGRSPSDVQLEIGWISRF